MGTFSYRARDFDGVSVHGKVEAPGPQEAKRMVSQMKLIPLEVKELTTSSSVEDDSSQVVSSFAGAFTGSPFGLWLQSFGEKVDIEEMMVLLQQLQTSYSCGVPLLDGLTMMASHVKNKALKKAMDKVIVEVKSGKTLSEAMTSHPRIFDEITVNMIKIGETSGQLEAILDHVIAVMQQKIEQTAKVKSALFYPKIVLSMIAIVFLVIVYFVLPKFKEFFERFDGDLPAITQIMMGLSDFFNTYWYAMMLAVGGVVWAIKKYLATENGRARWDAWALKVPFFGSLLLQIDMLTFCSLLDVLIRSGVRLTESLKVMKKSLANTVVRNATDTIEAKVQSGGTLTEGMINSGCFPPDLVSLVRIGEEAGDLETVLKQVSKLYKIQVDQKLANVSKVIEPILLVFVFGMVLALALAVFLPMWKMNSLIKK